MATNTFSKVLGQSGFGLVYKGNLPNGLEVAVKKLSSTSTQGPQEFLNEVFDFCAFKGNISLFSGWKLKRVDPCTSIQVLVSKIIQ